MVVIINADDLGMNQEVNRAIFQLMEMGAVTSATMLANGQDVEEAAAEAHRYPQCSFGVHLNLTEFAPLTGARGLRPILDDAGRFRGNRIREIHLDSPLKAAILEEWCAQIEKLAGLGIHPSHIDSHHHTHTLPALLPVLKRVGKKFAIEKVRISRNVYAPGEPLSLRMKKSAYNTALRQFAGFKTTDRFSGLDMFIAAGDEAQGAKSIELMVHPGAVDSEKEAPMLTKWLKDRQPGVKLISYKEL